MTHKKGHDVRRVGLTEYSNLKDNGNRSKYFLKQFNDLLNTLSIKITPFEESCITKLMFCVCSTKWVTTYAVYVKYRRMARVKSFVMESSRKLNNIYLEEARFYELDPLENTT